MEEEVKQTLEIPMRLPGLNEILNSKANVYNGHFSGYTALKKKWTGTIGLLIRSQGIQAVGRVFLHFTWTEPNKKRDPDNIAAGGKKLILDALVDCGILANDGWAQVAGWTDTFCVGDVSGVTVELEEK